MLRAAKKIIPLSVRTRLKWLYYAGQDAADAVRRAGAVSSRVPPKRKTFIGGGDFTAVGDDFFKTLKRHGLSPHMHVLDVGCGQGRMARPLIGFFEGGNYKGFDIVRSGIEWCQREYAGLDDFTFIHADVFNKRYNKEGGVAASDFEFPFETGQFDRVFLTSVFTHMYGRDVENYLGEISRVLKSGGRGLITWFLLDEISRRSQHPVLNFQYEIDDVSRTTVTSNPEAAIAFDIEYVKSILETHGLKIVDIEHGNWARPESAYGLQDLIILEKP